MITPPRPTGRSEHVWAISATDAALPAGSTVLDYTLEHHSFKTLQWWLSDYLAAVQRGILQATHACHLAGDAAARDDARYDGVLATVKAGPYDDRIPFDPTITPPPPPKRRLSDAPPPPLRAPTTMPVTPPGSPSRSPRVTLTALSAPPLDGSQGALAYEMLKRASTCRTWLDHNRDPQCHSRARCDDERGLDGDRPMTWERQEQKDSDELVVVCTAELTVVEEDAEHYSETTSSGHQQAQALWFLQEQFTYANGVLLDSPTCYKTVVIELSEATARFFTHYGKADYMRIYEGADNPPPQGEILV